MSNIIKIIIAIVLVAFAMPFLVGEQGTNGKQSLTENEKNPLSVKGKKIRVKHIEWSNEICNLIADKQVKVGMTSEQAQMAWGKPYKINETNYATHTREQWVMDSGSGGNYLYFVDGVLTTIQTSR